MEKRKSVVLFSGGLDSVVVAAFFTKLGHELVLLHLYEGPGCDNQRASAHVIAEQLDQKLVEFDLQTIIPQLKKDKSKYIPGYRNLYYTLGLQVAESEGTRFVLTGEMGSLLHPNWKRDPAVRDNYRAVGDRSIREMTFFSRFRVADHYNELYTTEDDDEFLILDPFGACMKQDLVTIGQMIDAPMDRSCSCRALPLAEEGEPDHCGDCWMCWHRYVSFKQAGVDDPTEYKANPETTLPRSYKRML